MAGSDQRAVRPVVLDQVQVEAVRGVSFSIERGEVFAFLGPNGAGKTTTVGMLVQADPPSNAACIGITCGLAVVFLALAVTGFGRPD